MRKNTTVMDMCSGPILPKLVAFAVPLVLTGVVQLLFNAADMVVVGKFGSQNSLAAVGSTSSLINLLINVFMGMAVGANTVVARKYGAGDYKGVQSSVHTTVAVSFITGLFVTVLGLISAYPLLTFMGTPDDVIELSALYIRIYFLGTPFNMFYNFGSAILRAVGDTKRPLYFLTFSGAINVILNLIFVIFLKLDVAGVALATVASQIISAILIFVALLKHNGPIRLFPSSIRVHKADMLQMMRIGVPAGIQSSMFSFSNTMVQSSINYLGTTVIAACSAASSIEGFIYIGMNCFYQAVLSFVSQNFGKKDFGRIKKIIFISLILVTVSGITGGVIVMLLHKPLLRLYMENPNDVLMLKYGFQRLSIVAIPYFLCGIMEVLVGALRGLGESFIPMISSIIGVCGARLLWIFTVFDKVKDSEVINVFGLNCGPLQILMLAWPVAWIATGLLHLSVLIYTYRKNSKKCDSIGQIPVYSLNSK